MAAHSPNRLLASLSSAVFAAIKPHLKPVKLRHGEVVAEAGAQFEVCTFPFPASSRWSLNSMSVR
jgi:hypothetical protein